MTTAGDPPATRPARAGVDAALGALLFATVAVYLAALPRSLFFADESYFLLEARRIRDGEALYRDVFYYATPAAHWLMALLFYAFGTTIGVAKLSLAVVHGLTAALLYACCRRLAVRRALAVLPALAYLAYCQSAWPLASYHWISTLLMVLILLLVLDRRRGRAGWWIAPGVVCGALIAVQQQKGVVVVAGVALLCLLDARLARRTAAAVPLPRGGRALQWFAVGVALPVVPTVAVMLVSAGWRAVVEQLVVYPLTDYRTLNHSAWGAVQPFTQGFAARTDPRLLRYAPAVLLLTAARALRGWRSGRHPQPVADLLALVLVGGAAALSIAYLPDFIHLAFIAPLCLVALAETAEAALAGLPPRLHVARPLAAALSAVLLALIGLHLWTNAAAWRGAYPIRHATAFGDVAFANADDVELVEQVSRRLEQSGAHEFFAYPVYTSLYLTTGAENPTPYQVLLPGYNSPRQIRQVIDILTAHALPYVYVCQVNLNLPDPLLAFLMAQYEVDVVTSPGCGIYRRRAP